MQPFWNQRVPLLQEVQEASAFVELFIDVLTDFLDGLPAVALADETEEIVTVAAVADAALGALVKGRQVCLAGDLAQHGMLECLVLVIEG